MAAILTIYFCKVRKYNNLLFYVIDKMCIYVIVFNYSIPVWVLYKMMEQQQACVKIKAPF